MADLKKKKTGAIYSWGWNIYGQLGCGKIGGQSWKPVMISSMKKKFAVAVTPYNFIIALTGSGGLVIWGQGDAGQLGNGETKSSGEGVKLVALKKGVVLAATGEQHTVAAKGVFSWGNGADGRLGHGDETTQLQPVPIQLFNTKKILSVACGAEHSAVIVEGAILYTWGKGQYGRLGHGDDKNQLSPKVVETLSSKTPKEVACGSDWTTVITANGVYSFGSGANGRLGIGNDHAQTLPTLVEGLNGLKIAQLTCGHHHTLVLTEAGQVFSYGYGGNGRLGHGNEADEKRPKEIEALKGKGVVFVAGGAYHSAAINGKNELLTWGWNHYGQLGFEGGQDHFQPTIVQELSGKKVVWVACGEGHSIAVVL